MAEGNFARFKKDLLFHEKRMQLLLGTRVVEDMQSCLSEKNQVRTECAQDCRGALGRFEKGASDPRLSGRWDELKVATLFKLEVPLRYVVDSSKFEAPEVQDTEMLEDLIRRLQNMSKRYPEFDHGDAQKNTETLINFLRIVKFTGHDITRMRDAVTAKLEVISELDDLTNVLQDSGFTMARLRTELEDLRRMEGEASREGETAQVENYVQQRIDLLGKAIDTTFFQMHTVESTIETNVARRKSNVSQFQSSAAMLEVLKSEKNELCGGCKRDEARIRRGMLFEEGAKDTGRGKVLDLQRQSAEKISALDARQEKLAARLRQLFDEVSEVEQALQQVGDERAEAVAAHIELVEGSRHATSDFMELQRYAGQYQERLDKTRNQYEEGLDALHLFERVLLQDQNFAQYDFNASANRLQSMRRHVCKELNGSLNELRTVCGSLIHRREAQIRKIESELEVQQCEAETRKEMLDPAAARFVQKVRDLERRRDQLLHEISDIRGVVARQEDTCLQLLRKHLPEDEITDVKEELRLSELQTREHIADLRESILTSTAGGVDKSGTDVHAARTELLRANQSGAPAAAPPMLPRHTTGSPSPAPEAAEAEAKDDGAAGAAAVLETRVVPSGMNRSAVAHAMRSRSSRVTAVREEIAKALEGPYSSAVAPVSALPDDAPSAADAAANGTVAAGGAGSSSAPKRRPVRVIGRDVDGPTGTDTST